MYQDRVVLCGANSYEEKYYLNPDFDQLPQSIKDELKIMCVLYVHDVGGILTLVFEDGFHVDLIIKAIGPILYAGVLSCGVAYTFQIIGQKNSSSPTVASLIMSFESVVAVVSEMLVLKNIMSTREAIGSFLMFTAIILSQIDFSAITKRRSKS